MLSYYLALEFSGEKVEQRNPLSFSPWRFIGISAGIVNLSMMLLPIVNYFGMSLLDDIEQLPTRVQDFRMEESQCTCCSNNHKDPQTGLKVMCDRELVYQSLKDIYHGGEGEGGEELEQFNQLVRKTLGPKVLWRAGARATCLPLRYVTCIVMVSNLPLLSDLIWHISQGPETPLVGMELFIWCMHLILQWLQPLSAMLFSMELSTRLWKIKNILKLPRILLAILLAPIQGLGAGCIFASMELLLNLMKNESSQAIAGPMTLWRILFQSL